MAINGVGKAGEWQERISRIAQENIRQIQESLNLEGQQVQDEDVVDISQEGQRALERAKALNEMQMDVQELQRQLENANAQAEGVGDGIATKVKCFAIAMRIMCGDQVPNADHRYLAEKDLSLYSKAMLMRMEKENPRKHKRLSEDEDPKAADQQGPERLSQPAEQSLEVTAGEASPQSGGDTPDDAPTQDAPQSE